MKLEFVYQCQILQKTHLRVPLGVVLQKTTKDFKAIPPKYTILIKKITYPIKFKYLFSQLFIFCSLIKVI